MANWIPNARAQAGYQNVPIQGGSGKVISEGPWQVVVELRSPDNKSIIVKFDKTNGQWTIC